jgi:hypothetical protein
MPARPIAPETLRLIGAVQDALAERLSAHATVEERTLFGCHAFMVDGKLCLAVKGEDLLVRLPPQDHAATAEQPAVRGLLLGRTRRLRHARAMGALGGRRHRLQPAGQGIPPQAQEMISSIFGL